MSIIAELVHAGAGATATAGILYTATVTTAALTALIARTPQRRCDARTVLTILLGRRSADDDRPRRSAQRTPDIRAHDFRI